MGLESDTGKRPVYTISSVSKLVVWAEVWLSENINIFT